MSGPFEHTLWAGAAACLVYTLRPIRATCVTVPLAAAAGFVSHLLLDAFPHVDEPSMSLGVHLVYGMLGLLSILVMAIFARRYQIPRAIAIAIWCGAVLPDGHHLPLVGPWLFHLPGIYQLECLHKAAHINCFQFSFEIRVASHACEVASALILFYLAELGKKRREKSILTYSDFSHAVVSVKKIAPPPHRSVR